MKQQAEMGNHLDLTCAALVLFTGWLFKDTTHRALAGEDTQDRQSCAG